MNAKLLKSKMALYGDNQNKLAEYLEIWPLTLSHKINQKNGKDFSQQEILNIKKRYDLTCDELDAIFFGEKVS